MVRDVSAMFVETTTYGSRNNTVKIEIKLTRQLDKEIKQNTKAKIEVQLLFDLLYQTL